MMFQKNLDQIITKSNLKQAYRQINKNTSGIDEVSFEEWEKDFNANLAQLAQDIQEGHYTPEPLKKIEIAKPQSNEKRPIALSAIKDKIVQRVLYMYLNPYFDKQFSDKSYAYRPDKSTLKAINRVSNYLQQGFTYVVKTDIDNFFEEIDHDILLQILSYHIADKKIIRLISLFVQTGGFKRYDYDEHSHGVHQGDILSPLLSNIYLDAMDKYLQKHDVAFIRYADDFVMLFKNEDQAQKRLKKLQKYLESMKLHLEKEKTFITHINDGFTFLGVHFEGNTNPS